MADAERLRDFVRESNRIEGILREPLDSELAAHRMLLASAELTVGAVDAFVQRVAGPAPLRKRIGLDVRVGNHCPPAGCPEIKGYLAGLLLGINEGLHDPHNAHLQYEQLHPFMDGNGRSGRAIWAWQMQRDGYDPFRLGFLHRFYYQTLSAGEPHHGD
jgi:hypothetical protein